MGQAASSPNAIDDLPDIIEEAVAQEFLGECFQRAEWESLSMGTGSVHKQPFVEVLNERNFPPRFRTWLESWRIADLSTKLSELGIDDPIGFSKLSEAQIEGLELKAVQKRHFAMASAHAAYLSKVGLTMPFSPLGARRVESLNSKTSPIEIADLNQDDDNQEEVVVLTEQTQDSVEKSVEISTSVSTVEVPPASTDLEVAEEGPVEPPEPVEGQIEAEVTASEAVSSASEQPVAPSTPEKVNVNAESTASPECPPSPSGSGLSAARALANSPQQEQEDS